MGTRSARRAEARRNSTPFVPQIAPYAATRSRVVRDPFTPRREEEGPKHDPALKGVKGKNCNITHCQQAGAVYYNRAMCAYYCSRCAHRINECPVEGGPLCTLDEEAVAIYRATRDE
jgi:hypothetical protein